MNIELLSCVTGHVASLAKRLVHFRYSGQIYLVNHVTGQIAKTVQPTVIVGNSGDIITAYPGEAAMADATIAELVESVVRAGRDWGLGIGQVGEGHLRVGSRGDRRLERPIEILFTTTELRAYYREIADEAERGAAPEPPWEWWMTLMSTHLMEAVHEMDRRDEPCVITVTATGFAATPAPQARS